MTTQTVQRESRLSLVPAPVAGLASLLLPGLGQLLARQLQRGLTLLGSTLTIVGLFVWRIDEIGWRQEGFGAKLSKSLSLQPAFVIMTVAGILALWLWSAWDAYRQAQPDQQGGLGIFALILVIFFVIGWQVSQINLYKLVTELSEAGGPLSRIAWPWEAAITRETETLSAAADILAPCDDQPPPEPPEETSGEPYLVADPTCGNLSEQTTEGDQLVTVPGTLLTVTGRGFEPNTKTAIWWIDPLGNEFQIRQGGEYLTITTDDQGEFEIEINMPYRLIPPSAEGRQIHQIEARQVSETGGFSISRDLRLITGEVIETIFMGMMATFFGIILAIPLSFLAARNLMSGSPITMGIYFVVRTILNVFRSIEAMIWAIIAVTVVGLGPAAGVLALLIHSSAALGKLYSEAIESIDPGPIEAIQATGATRLQTIVYAVIPQMIPPFVSFSIYRWDINVRMSTIIGLVGGGGIGLLLTQYMKLLRWRSAGICVWFIAITVAILDYVSSEIRQRFV